MKKSLLVGMVAIVLTLTSSLDVLAVSHISGCTTTSHRVECGSFIGTVSAGTHVLYSTPNGNVVCQKWEQKHLHNVYCANSRCNVKIYSNQARTCMVLHSACPDETGKCQY